MVEMPDLKKTIIDSINKKDNSLIIDFLKTHFTDEVKKRMDKNYLRGQSQFITELEGFIKGS